MHEDIMNEQETEKETEKIELEAEVEVEKEETEEQVETKMVINKTLKKKIVRKNCKPAKKPPGNCHIFNNTMKKVMGMGLPIMDKYGIPLVETSPFMYVQIGETI